METADARCPVCAHSDVVAAATPNPHHRLCRCASCGHAFVSPFDLDEDENATIQLENFSDDFAGREGFFITLYERLNARRTARALNLGKGCRVLEIGPGSGFLMQWLANRGHDVLGLDLSPSVARHIELRWHARVVVGQLDSHLHTVGEKAYDVIIMRHVLEHFSDPLLSLRAACAALKPGGKLYVAVPNMDSWHRYFRGWSGYEPYHVHYFGEACLSLALRRAGFDVSRTETYEPIAGWVNTFMRSITGYGTGPAGIALRRRGWKRWMLESARLFAGIVLSPVRWIQAGLGRGEELTAIGVRTEA